MKLRNKLTGEIGELQITEKHCAVAAGNGTASCGIEIYSSLAELNSEWEDYHEEPKEHWYIDCDGEVISPSEALCNEEQNSMKQIGNHFGTKEEAEKAVERLRAWKRLKDKGFVFKGINMVDGSIKTGLSKGVSLDDCEGFYDDMNFLFGGEDVNI